MQLRNIDPISLLKSPYSLNKRPGAFIKKAKRKGGQGVLIKRNTPSRGGRLLFFCIDSFVVKA